MAERMGCPFRDLDRNGQWLPFEPSLGSHAGEARQYFASSPRESSVWSGQKLTAPKEVRNPAHET